MGGWGCFPWQTSECTPQLMVVTSQWRRRAEVPRGCLFIDCVHPADVRLLGVDGPRRAQPAQSNLGSLVLELPASIKAFERHSRRVGAHNNAQGGPQLPIGGSLPSLRIG